MVRKELMAYRPKAKDAQVEMGEPHALVGLKPDQRKQRFLPTDVVVGTDGAIYLSDFYNDTSRRTNQLSGTISRITRKDNATGNLVGMHTLLTSSNVVTIKPLPCEIPGLIRIAEKAKGGIECVVSAQRQQFYSLTHTHLRAPAAMQGEVIPDERAIDGMIRIAGQECPFRLELQ